MDPEVGTEGSRRLFPDFETQWNLPGWNSTFWGTSDSFSFSFTHYCIVEFSRVYKICNITTDRLQKYI